MSTNQQPPATLRILLNDGKTVYDAQLLTADQAAQIFGVSSTDGLIALYAFNNQSALSILYGVDFDVGTLTTVQGQQYVFSDLIRYGRPAPPLQTKPAFVLAQGPQVAWNGADTQLNYVVGDAQTPPNRFQTSDKNFAVTWVNIFGGGLIPSFGTWPGIPTTPPPVPTAPVSG